MGSEIRIHPADVLAAAGTLSSNEEAVDGSALLSAAGSALQELPDSEALAAWSGAAYSIGAALDRYRTANSDLQIALRDSARTYQRTDREISDAFRSIKA